MINKAHPDFPQYLAECTELREALCREWDALPEPISHGMDREGLGLIHKKYAWKLKVLQAKYHDLFEDVSAVPPPKPSKRVPDLTHPDYPLYSRACEQIQKEETAAWKALNAKPMGDHKLHAAFAMLEERSQKEKELNEAFDYLFIEIPLF